MRNSVRWLVIIVLRRTERFPDQISASQGVIFRIEASFLIRLASYGQENSFVFLLAGFDIIPTLVSTKSESSFVKLFTPSEGISSDWSLISYRSPC